MFISTVKNVNLETGKFMLEILFEDEYLIAINKPAGLLVIPTPKNEKNTLTDKINDEFAKRGLEVRAHPCHRIDRETSGVIIYAKGKKMQQKIMDLFHLKKVSKKYMAVASGEMSKDFGEINHNIENKPAITRYKVLKKTADYTVCEVEILTGRTNQIRIHFKNIGHPLLGESKYAFRKDFKIKFKRTALHSLEIRFVHPETREEISICAPIPEDMKRFI
jgi:23S rRNA pseudouridine1911/1915/1917 synthase